MDAGSETKHSNPSLISNPTALNPINQSRNVTFSNTRKITGSNKSGSSKLVSSSQGKWFTFVGHLSRETTEDDIKEHLECNNITVIEVKKLPPKQPWQEKSSAFRVCINLNCKDSIMNSDLWPDNSDVRDWYFKPKP